MSSVFVVILGIAQVLCLAHLILTRRSLWWLLLLFLIPGLGTLLYFTIEMLPDLRSGDMRRRINRAREAAKSPEARVRDRRAALEEAPTIDNKVRLAEALIETGRPEEAATLLEDAATGPHDDDVFILGALAEARYRNHQYGEALAALDRADATGFKDRQPQRDLLRARCLHTQGDTEIALPILRALADRYPGEEARYRLAVLLRETGQEEEARQAFKRIADRARERTLYRKQNAAWIDAARKALK
ncbi:MAG: tetratricopeptide repeat protein [Opitutales bacterium]